MATGSPTYPWPMRTRRREGAPSGCELVMLRSVREASRQRSRGSTGKPLLGKRGRYRPAAIAPGRISGDASSPVNGLAEGRDGARRSAPDLTGDAAPARRVRGLGIGLAGPEGDVGHDATGDTGDSGDSGDSGVAGRLATHRRGADSAGRGD